ncbi:MAG: coproporphyrinogen III oxidase family protein [Kiritimatiellae bacterium]|nr:coproporphyrinogen III oxidase family protein [Kiritimatiellia bacterium]
MPAEAKPAPANLYVHFPFCRRKCTYCALHSRATTEAARSEYVARIAQAIPQALGGSSALSTIYFGGGSPALCCLGPVLDALAPFLGQCASAPEFTVEMHPLDVTREKLKELKDGGVNRISMGVQSLDDGILRHMGRGYTIADAKRAFSLVREHFDNAGIDLIVGYPGDRSFERLTDGGFGLSDWGLKHCSVYSLILEESSILAKMLERPNESLRLPGDDEVLDQIAAVSRYLKSIGLERYEISNYAVPGCECRHNMATWRGEDYIGLGDGAHGRRGLLRTANWWPQPWGQTPENWGQTPENWGQTPEIVEISAEKDKIERRIFSLRTREGLDAEGRPEWIGILDRFVSEGLLTKDGSRYRLTARGTEVCDTILAELV